MIKVTLWKVFFERLYESQDNVTVFQSQVVILAFWGKKLHFVDSVSQSYQIFLIKLYLLSLLLKLYNYIKNIDFFFKQ